MHSRLLKHGCSSLQGDVFGPFIVDSSSGAFSWSRDPADPKSKVEGWDLINGTVHQPGNKVALHYYHTKVRGGAPTGETGTFNGDCDHLAMHDSPWVRTPPSTHPHPVPPVSGGTWPNATWTALAVAPGATVTIKIALGLGLTEASTAAAVAGFAADEQTFDTAWSEAHAKWEQRWQQAFTPGNGYWSGNLPTLDLPAGPEPAGVARVFYMSCLTVISQTRTNLPLIHKIAWPNGNGTEDCLICQPHLLHPTQQNVRANSSHAAAVLRRQRWARQHGRRRQPVLVVG